MTQDQILVSTLLSAIAISGTLAAFVQIRRYKKRKQETSMPGKKITIRYDCMVTEIIPIKNNMSGLNFFERELTNRGINFDHIKVKDLGYSWINKERKRGFNQYEIEYWSWD